MKKSKIYLMKYFKVPFLALIFLLFFILFIIISELFIWIYDFQAIPYIYLISFLITLFISFKVDFFDTEMNIFFKIILLVFSFITLFVIIFLFSSILIYHFNECETVEYLWKMETDCKWLIFFKVLPYSLIIALFWSIFWLIYHKIKNLFLKNTHKKTPN